MPNSNGLNLNVLIIDDEIELVESLTVILEEIGITNVFSLQSGIDSVNNIKKIHQEKNIKIDLILCDYSMPGKDGLEVFCDLKNDPFTQNIGHILISGHTDQTFILKAIQLGIQNILIKPFSKQLLISEISKLITP